MVTPLGKVANDPGNDANEKARRLAVSKQVLPNTFGVSEISGLLSDQSPSDL